MEMAKVEFFLECLAIRVGRYVDLGDVPFGDTVFIDRSRIGVCKAVPAYGSEVDVLVAVAVIELGAGVRRSGSGI